MSVSTLTPRTQRRIARALPRLGAALSANVRAAYIRARERFGCVEYSAPKSALQPEHLFAYTREEND